jgi:hypothetical protein
MVMGVKTEHRTRSVFALFGHELYRRAMEYGALGGEASWILEDNYAMTRPMEAMGAKVYRKWRIYDRLIRRPERSEGESLSEESFSPSLRSGRRGE